MNIAYVSYVRIPTEKAHGAQIMKTCEAFARAGVSVKLIVPARKNHITENPFKYYGVEPIFQIVYVPTPDFISLGPLGFLVSMLWFAEVARWRKSFSKANIIYSRDALILMQYSMLRKKLVYEAHTKPTLISRLATKLVANIVTISKGLKDVYRMGDRSIVAPDAIDPNLFVKKYEKQKVRELLGIPTDEKVALYVGRIDEAKGAYIFAAASKYVDKGICCVLIGSAEKEIMKLRAEFPEALFLPETKYRDIAQTLSAADVLILPNSGKEINAALYTSPLKAFAYLATDKPIIASDVPALRECLEEHAYFVKPDDPRMLANIISKCLAQEPLTRVPYVYSWDDRVERIISAIT